MRSHRAGDALQESEQEAAHSRDLDLWLSSTEWMPKQTRSGHRVVQSVDSGEVRWEPPSPEEAKQRKARAEAVARTAKIASSGKTGIAEGLAAKLGAPLDDILEEYRKNEAAAANKSQRGNKKRSKDFGNV